MRNRDRFARYAAIGAAAARIYLGYKAITFGERYLGLKDAAARRLRHHQRSARLLYRTAVRLQGPMIKLAQGIGSRPDLVPIEYVEVLSRLQDQVPPRPFRVIRRVIEDELGRTEKVFMELQEEPLAAASWAQVHKARLKDGRWVAVKVQYPGVSELLDIDLHSIRFLLGLLEKLERGLTFAPIIDELAEYMPLELDFLHEAENANRIAADFERNERVVVPRVIWELSTRRVLVLEYIEGARIGDVAALKRDGIDQQALAQLLTETYCEQMLVHGLFNADPHPGNFLVQPGPKLVLLDFGLCRSLSEAFRKDYVRLTRAMLLQNPVEIVAAFGRLGVKTRTADPASLLLMREAFVEVTRPGKAYADADLVVDAQIKLARAFRSNPLVQFPRELVLIMRAVGLLSGIGKLLESEVDWIGTTLRYIDGPVEAEGPVLSHRLGGGGQVKGP